MCLTAMRTTFTISTCRSSNRIGQIMRRTNVLVATELREKRIAWAKGQFHFFHARLWHPTGTPTLMGIITRAHQQGWCVFRAFDKTSSARRRAIYADYDVEILAHEFASTG